MMGCCDTCVDGKEIQMLPMKAECKVKKEAHFYGLCFARNFIFRYFINKYASVSLNICWPYGLN